jgi:hypothetical protein
MDNPEKLATLSTQEKDKLNKKHNMCWTPLYAKMLPVSLDCPFLIAPSVFSNIVYSMLPVSLDCPFFIAPSVFSNIEYIQIYILMVRFILKEI